MLKARYFLSVSRQEPNQWTQSVYWSSAAVSLLCQNAHIVLSCCHLLQIKTLLQCTPAGHQREALSLCLLLAVGFSISFMRMILGYRHQDWSMNHLAGPIHAGGQNGCKVTSADSSHVPVFHHLMTAFWKAFGEKLCLLFILTCMNFWTLKPSGEFRWKHLWCCVIGMGALQKLKKRAFWTIHAGCQPHALVNRLNFLVKQMVRAVQLKERQVRSTYPYFSPLAPRSWPNHYLDFLSYLRTEKGVMILRQHHFLAPVTSPLLHKRGYWL